MTSISVQTNIRDSDTQTLPILPDDVSTLPISTVNFRNRPCYDFLLSRDDVEYKVHANEIERMHARISQGDDVVSIRARARMMNLIAEKQFSLAKRRIRDKKSRELSQELNCLDSRVFRMRAESADRVTERMKHVSRATDHFLAKQAKLRAKAFRPLEFAEFAESEETPPFILQECSIQRQLVNTRIKVRHQNLIERAKNVLLTQNKY